MGKTTLDDLDSSLREVVFSLRKMSVKMDMLREDMDYVKIRLDSPKVDSMYSLTQVCQLLDVSKRTVQRLRSRRQVKYYILNGRSYYPKNEVERLLKMKKK